MKNLRTPLVIMLSVWEALFLREAVYRLSSKRVAWLWLLLEPMFGFAFLMFIFTTLRMRTVGGIDIEVWILLGLLGYYMFQQVGKQAANAINANQALFTYRQVKPIDTVLVRAGLEGFLVIMIAIIFCAGAGLYGIKIKPADPLFALTAFFGLWLLGLGYGLLFSVVNELLPEVGKLASIAMIPLHLLSGVIFPLSLVPQPYYHWLMFNPIVHGLECIRVAFSPGYHVLPETSIFYLFSFVLVFVFLGFVLHNFFAARLVTQ